MFTTEGQIAPNRLKEALADSEGVRILDVRTPAEFEATSIPGAYNVPLDTLDDHTDDLREVSESLVIVCRSGQRSTEAKNRLAQAGMDNIGVLEGGMEAWQSADGDVRRGAQRWALERQVRLVAGSLVLTGIVGSSVAPPMKCLSGAVGAGLTFAALTDSCFMSKVLGKLPYNRSSDVDVTQTVAQLKSS